MMIVRLLIASATALSCVSAAHSEVSDRDRKAAACYDDVQRLCGQFIPDADRVTACMKDKRPKVSKLCSKMWNVQ